PLVLVIIRLRPGDATLDCDEGECSVPWEFPGRCTERAQGIAPPAMNGGDEWNGSGRCPGRGNEGIQGEPGRDGRKGRGHDGEGDGGGTGCGPGGGTDPGVGSPAAGAGTGCGRHAPFREPVRLARVLVPEAAGN